MPFSGRPISPRDLHLIEESLRGVPIIDPDLGDAPPLPEELIPAMVQAVHASRSAIVLTDADLDDGPHILYANPACERLTGYAAGDILGLTPRIFQGDSTDRSVLDLLRSNLERGWGYEGDVINYRKDGVPYVVSLRITPVRTDGRPSFFVAIEDDATRTWLLRTQREQNLAALHDTLAAPPSSLRGPGLDVAHKTLAVDDSDVGGDWADVVDDDQGRVHLVLGDASGHGIVAGIYVGRYRWPLWSLLRAGTEPAEALAELGRMNAELATMASIGVVTIAADRRSATVITAGHPDVVVATATGIHRVRTEHPMIGVATDTVHDAASIALPAGSIVCMFSDGLVERREEPLDVGIEAVVDALRAATDGIALDALADQVIILGRSEGRRDDVDLLMARV